MVIRPIRVDDVPEVVDIHRQVLGETFNSRLGLGHLRWLYQQCLQVPSFCSVLVAENEHGVVGFLSGTRDLGWLEGMLKHRFSGRTYALAGIVLLRHPHLLGELLGRRHLERYLRRHCPKPWPFVLTVGVRPGQQQSGVGRALMQSFEVALAGWGVASCYVDTKVENTQAQSFYAKLGWQQLTTVGGNVLLAKDVDDRSPHHVG